MFLYQIYRLISYLFTIILPFFLIYRLITGKEESDRFWEKLTINCKNKPDPIKKLLWFHAASVGELKSILPLIQELEKELNILVTTVTVTSAQIFKNAGLKNTIHQYVPFDIPYLVKRFLKHWKPNLGVFIDSELWPNIINYASEQGVVLLNLNARLSSRSSDRWLKIPSLINYMYGKFTFIAASSRLDALRISRFADENKISYFGNLKYSSCNTTYDKNEYDHMHSQLKGRLIWLAASIHKGEEGCLLEAHKKLLMQYKDLLLIMVPRHPKNGNFFKEQAINYNLTPAIRSGNDGISSINNVYIADTIGELGIWYRLSNIIFVGGSLIPHGGQNMLEPAALNSAIIVGPHTGNFQDVVEDFRKANAIIEIENTDNLFKAIENLIIQPDFKNDLIKAAQNIVKQTSGVLDKSLELIRSHIINL